MATLHRSFAIACLFAAAATMPAFAEPSGGLFDVEARREQLARGAVPEAQAACLAVARDPEWARLAPVSGLSSTDGYGTDQTSQPFSWAVMVLSSRALGGDDDARSDLRKLLVDWARADALAATEQAHDAYYALKRTLLPTIVAYQVVQPEMSAGEQAEVSAWLDKLVRMIDHRFGGDVDRNNHRLLADSVLALWGAASGSEDLYAAGIDGFRKTLAQTRPDGSLPLEVRRGARSIWYERQAMASLVVIAETAARKGDDLYTADPASGAASLNLVAGYLAGILAEPNLVLAYAAANYIPGPELTFTKLDLGYADRRPTGRHYLAFLEPLEARKPSGFAYQRLTGALNRLGADERPLIDEFSGGNATCFWRQS